MLRRPWRTVIASAAVLGSSYYLYNRTRRPSSAPETFDVSIRSSVAGPDGKRGLTTQTLPLLPMTDVEARIKEYANLRVTPRHSRLIWKHATAQLASNNPIEDAHAEAIVERDQQDGDYLFFAVMDGHSGPYTSRLLSKTLIPAVALQLRELSESPSSFDSKAGRTSLFDSIRSLFNSSTPKAPGAHTVPFDADPKFVALAIQTAFAMVDSEIANAPLRLIQQHLKEIGAKPNDPLPDLSQHPMALASMVPALSGSCAILALLDTAHRDLYVACTGDCRAVAGVWEESPDGSGNGTWRVDVLSDDQTGRNPSELKRLQSEHPKDEAMTVVQRGRILGGLEPSRAFGDSRYKWPLHIQQILSRVFMEGNDKPVRRPPPAFKTPPYVTAQPVITHRKLDFLPLAEQPPAPFPSPSPAATSSKLRFLILATDGLWDQLSSQDAVALVGAHLSGLRIPSISRSSLQQYAPTKLGDSVGVEGKDKLATSSNTNGKEEGGLDWTFVDSHPGTHLLRNAFGGADKDKLQRLVSLPAPISRRFRDDVTVTVVWWEDGRAMEARLENIRLAATGVAGVAPSKGAVQAKL
ncbi:protein serine/threonine phosphatase 2C [Fomitiporia mediterranea MF3/22]|uniref:protein serine/threonine phosphatase 2C n=1 Tax=Fomitiporia mediterranea (strain MF3/22) TaxID=694068 RepID=UPI00044089DB|nr:protein serine/threonine phosphatase 2C [Fomitiporia mediterranea MF3/22]EJD01523.1 protein serine/threonine phosphatase 2C [Fomitiporia mediterranea MF3/22]